MEEVAFSKTLDRGIARFEATVAGLSKVRPFQVTRRLCCMTPMGLFDLTALMASEKGCSIDGAARRADGGAT